MSKRSPERTRAASPFESPSCPEEPTLARSPERSHPTPPAADIRAALSVGDRAVDLKPIVTKLETPLNCIQHPARGVPKYIACVAPGDVINAKNRVTGYIVMLPLPGGGTSRLYDARDLLCRGGVDRALAFGYWRVALVLLCRGGVDRASHDLARLLRRVPPEDLPVAQPTWAIHPDLKPLEALLSAFDRFYNALYATTVPAEGGRRSVDGIPHAVALSEATDALYRELFATQMRLVKQHGRGVAPMESESPDGPPSAIKIAAMGIGGSGADAVLLAALDSAAKVVAFPIAKWNAMEAARPGANHHRFHAGDVVSADDLAKLASAAKLLCMKAPAPAVPAGGASNGQLPQDDGQYLPATCFPKGMAARLRMAAQKNRKTKRVSTKTVDGVVLYSVVDARRWWPNDVPKVSETD
jgi:hypothetical protein